MAGESVAGLFRLVRPANVLITLAAQLLFVHCFSSLPETVVWPVAVGLALLVAGGNAINDYYDREVDARNRPERVILGRLLPPQVGPVVFVLTSAGAVLLGWRVDGFIGGLFTLIAAALWAYSAWTQRQPLVGNVMVAALLAVPLVVWCHWPSAVDCTAALRYAAVVFTVNLLREFVKDQEDAAGDAAAGYRTLPVTASPQTVRRIGHLLFGLFYVAVVGLLQWAFAVRGHFLWFMVLVLGVLLPAVYVHFIWHYSHRPRQWRAVHQALKALMVIGMGTLAFGCVG